MSRNFNPAPAAADEKQELANQALSKCTSEGLSEECYAREFALIAENRGAEFAFEVLFALQQKDQTAIGCHLIAHGIGLGAYRHNPENWQEEIRNINPACNYGAIHGIIENYAANLPGQKLTKEIVPDICGENPRADCNHIVGHLVLLETGGNVDKALDVCGVFSHDPLQLEFCYTGVFMEFQTAINLIAHGLATSEWLNWSARLPELEAMCRSHDGLKAISCWKEITHAAVVKFSNNPEKVFAFCDTAPIAEAAYECKSHSVGIMAAGLNFDYTRTKHICSAPQKDLEFVGKCHVHLASSTMSTIPQATEQTRQYCLSLESVFQQNCLNQIEFSKRSSQQWMEIQ